MKKLVVLLPLVFAFACASGPVKPAGVTPRANLTAKDYYPLAAGWKWAYDVERENAAVLATYVVLESSGDTASVLAGQEKLGSAITPEGVAQKEGNVLGDYVIKNPVTVGTEWPVEGGRARIVSVTEEQDVDSLGHLLGCVRVETTRENPIRITRTIFAPDVGPVAVEVQVQDPAGGGKFVTEMRARLRAVTKPGEDAFR
jgi:hypothetical protein